MYIPTQFRETDIPTIHAAIGESGLATLVTTGAGSLRLRRCASEAESQASEPWRGPGFRNLRGEEAVAAGHS